jgi:hypothetical protein
MRMVARVLTFSGADPAKREEGAQRIRERVLPMLQAQDGYAGYLALFDEAAGGMTAVVLWESREAAEASEAQLAPMREKMTQEFGLTIESNQVFDAPIVELGVPART